MVTKGLGWGQSTFGIFGVFPNDAARDARLAGGVGQALGPNTGTLFSEPNVEKLDVIADKLPGSDRSTPGGPGARGP